MRLRYGQFLLILCSLLILVGGCSKDPSPPPPLAADRISPELERVYKAAKAETKDLVTKVSTGLQSKDYATSYDAVQALIALPDLTKEQRALSVRAMLTIYGLLQDAQAQGDEKAAAALRYHQATK
jgi:hypothetical protein